MEEEQSSGPSQHDTLLGEIESSDGPVGPTLKLVIQLYPKIPCSFTLMRYCTCKVKGILFSWLFLLNLKCFSFQDCLR